MKLIYKGTGGVRIEGVGPVLSGKTIDLPSSLAQTLIKQNPKEWASARELIHETGGETPARPRSRRRLRKEN